MICWIEKNKRFLIILGIIVAVAVVVIIIAVNAAQPRVINENDPVDYSSGKIEYSYYDAEADEQKTEIVEAGGEDTLRTVAEKCRAELFWATARRFADGAKLHKSGGGQPLL
jgi:ABC-type antimicrobial peptide transport system permease subunit